MTVPPTRKRISMNLHAEDYPATLAILHALFVDRLEAAAEVGYQPNGHGAAVDWHHLENCWLSTSETAAVTVARGICRMEGHGGGFPARLADPIRDAIAAMSPDRSAGRRTERHP